MEIPIEITITDVFATTERVILCLSHHVSDEHIRNSIWKNPENYVLSKIQSDHTDQIELTDETISYTNEIPAVIFIVTNVEDDLLHLLSKHSNQEFDVAVGHAPIPEENECCEKVLELIAEVPGKVTTIDDSVQQLKGKVTSTDDSVHKLTYEEIPSIKDSIAALTVGMTNIDKSIQRLIFGEIPTVKESIKVMLEDKVTNPIQKLTLVEIPDIQNSLKKLTDHIGTVPEGIEAIEGQLKIAKEDLSKSKNQGKDLAAEIVGEWQKVLIQVDVAMQNQKIQLTDKSKIESLRSHIHRELSQIGSLKTNIDNPPPVVKTRVEHLKDDTLTKIDQALASIGNIRQTIMLGA
jgi:chromosome segregation ATPase